MKINIPNNPSLFSKFKTWLSGYSYLDGAILLGTLVLAFVPSNIAYAGRIEPVATKCWYLVSDRIQIRNTCIYESHSWTGGGVSYLLWEDGVKTVMTWGLVDDGDPNCQNGRQVSVDGVCGLKYARDPVNLKYLSESWIDDAARCVRLKRHSVCWMHPY